MLAGANAITSGIMNRPRTWWYTMRGPNQHRKVVSTMAEDIMHPTMICEKVAQWIKGRHGYLHRYRCRCGNEFVAQASDVRNSKARTCGCGRYGRLIHGMSGHPLYWVHKGILSRCLSPRNPDYKDYGGRGIRVCEQWRTDRNSFFHWALSNGWAKGLLIDRINVDGDYEPANCRFVTVAVSNTNKRAFQGKLTASDVRKMRQMWSCGESIRRIAETFGVAYYSAWKTVHKINHADLA